MALLILAVFSLLLASATALFRGPLADVFSTAPDDPIFGPIDAPGAVNVLITAFLQTVCVAGASYAMLWLSRKHPSRRWAHALLALTALDLAVANGWMIHSAPRSLWSGATGIDAVLRDDPAQAGYRVHRAVHYGWFPSTIAQHSSPDRLAETIPWDRGLLMPKYHLEGRHRLTMAPSTIESQDYFVLMDVAARFGQLDEDTRPEPNPAVLRALSARYVIASETLDLPDAELVELPPEQQNLFANVRLMRFSHPFPRAWIVHDVEVLEPLPTNDPAVVGRRTRDVWFPKRVLRDFRRTAVVEHAAPKGKSLTWQRLTALHSEPSSSSNEEQPPSTDNAAVCRIVVDEPQRVEIEVELDHWGLLVLNDLYYPGWMCSHGEVLRTNRTMRGVLLPPGSHRVVFDYRPRSFFRGAAISGVAWTVLLAAFLGVWTYRAVARRLSRKR